MSVFRTYKGGRLDLEHYKGKSVTSFEIDVYNEDDTDFDLGVFDQIVLKIFDKIHGTEILSFDDDTSEIVISGNTILWSATRTKMNIRPKIYWHECYGVKTSGDIQELIFQGTSEMI